MINEEKFIVAMRTSVNSPHKWSLLIEPPMTAENFHLNTDSVETQ